MECDYVQAKEICREALMDWRYAVNDHLPDYDGSYYIDWTMEDALYVQSETNKAIDIVLSTCMGDHKRYELHQIQNGFAEAIKANNIDKCKRIMKSAHWEFYCIIKALKAIN